VPLTALWFHAPRPTLFLRTRDTSFHSLTTCGWRFDGLDFLDSRITRIVRTFGSSSMSLVATSFHFNLLNVTARDFHPSRACHDPQVGPSCDGTGGFGRAGRKLKVWARADSLLDHRVGAGKKNSWHDQA